MHRKKNVSSREKKIDLRNIHVRVLDKVFGDLNNVNTDGATLPSIIEEAEPKCRRV